MASATLKISSANGGEYPLTLTEDGGQVTQGVLSLLTMRAGKWNVDVGGGVPAGTNVVNIVADTHGAQRGALDWPDLGRALFGLLFPDGPLRARWDQDQLAGIDTLYLDVEPPELARVPWELSRSPNPERRLALNFALTRRHAARTVASGSSEWPFRVLLLVGCLKTEESKLEVEREIDEIRRVFLPIGRSVDVHVERRPLRDDLFRLIRGTTSQQAWHPHVLHFVGHAGPRPAGGVGLRIDRPDTNSWVWASDDVQVDLSFLGWVPQFVFLNACRTATEHGNVWSMQRSFASAGTKSVLTMQADVAGGLSGLFAKELYSRMAQGQSVEKAACQARFDVQNKQGGGLSIDWALPSLTTNEADLTLFKPKDAPIDALFKKCEEFEEARFFADCYDGRRLLTQWICPAVQPLPGSRLANLMLVTGAAKSGKSHLLKWVMESWVISGARVCYIELNDLVKKDFLSVLRRIRDGDGETSTRYLQRPLPPAAFRRFNWELNNLLDTGVPGDWLEAQHAGQEVIDDAGLPYTARGEKRPEPIICAGFHEALKMVAATQRLILVFDRFSEGGASLFRHEDFRQLVNYLFKPIADDEQSAIKVVFSANSAEVQTYELNDLPTPLVAYPLRDDHSTKELIAWAVEMMWFEKRKDVKRVAEALLLLPGQDLKGLARLTAVRHAMPSRWLDLIARMR